MPARKKFPLCKVEVPLCVFLLTRILVATKTPTLFSQFSLKNLKTIYPWTAYGLLLGLLLDTGLRAQRLSLLTHRKTEVYQVYKIPLDINLWDNVSRKEHAANVREKEGLVHNLCLYRQICKIGSIFAMDLYSNNYQPATSLTTHP